MGSPFSVPGVVTAAQLQRPPAALVSFGIAEIDVLTGGLPRGALTEICGAPSSGRTSLLLAALAAGTRRQELCALVDASDSFDPQSAASAGVELERLLWVRCGNAHRGSTRIDTDPRIAELGFENSESGEIHSRQPQARKVPNPKSRIRNFWLARVEQALKTTDLLLQSGGFGMVVVDLAGVPAEFARRVPLASWFRFRRAVEHTPTALLVLEEESYAKTCASLVLRTRGPKSPPFASLRMERAECSSSQEGEAAAAPLPGAQSGHAQLFAGITVEVEVLRARDLKKPVHGTGKFDTRAEWAG